MLIAPWRSLQYRPSGAKRDYIYRHPGQFEQGQHWMCSGPFLTEFTTANFHLKPPFLR
tara:strand:- start:185 stop:358 length:174 start_codon:yes stop_codon:yes gene_type:complete